MSELVYPTAPVHTVTLANGLQVVYQYQPTAAVAIGFWVRAGSAAEPVLYNGVAHALEHMVFRGSERFPAGAFDRLIEQHGGLTNAATSQDYAYYHVLTPLDHWQESLTALADILLRPTLAAEAWQQEQAVIAEELRQAQDQPDWVGQQMLWQRCYSDHPYGRPILGTEASLARITPAVLQQFHRQHYHPANMVVVVVGAVPWEALVAVLEETCTVPWSAPPATSSLAALPVMQPSYHRLSCPQAEQGRLWWVWPVPETQEATTGWGLDLLAAILTGGRMARLTRRLREAWGWVQDIDAGYHHQLAGGHWQLTAWLNNGVCPEQVQAVIAEEIWALQTQPVSPDELRRAKRQLLHAYTFAMETPQQMAQLYGYYHYVGWLEQGMHYPERLHQFGPEDLQQLACRYLHPEQAVRLWLQPGETA
ncbi:MAG: pitrilysin family protein [Gloeomargarita sp. SKYBB_i_bin120]|nr:insulinase family protein [Gloeomargarita sp. SKYG98]MCS7292859.1 insulinase family protein [Gloeomargarita sp. SKYB120]MDW8178422.1 pitrilysin family protein [Gloeomargarita sp. SKYBB_i_bin120]